MEKTTNWKSLIGEFLQGKAGLYIAIGVTGLLLIYFVFSMLTDSKGTIEIGAVKETVNTIDLKVDSIKEDQQFILQRLYEVEKGQIRFEEAVEKNNELIRKTNANLNKLQKTYNEKIRNVNTYSNSQLDSFFTSKYGKTN